MDEQLARAAISAALSGRWEEALSLNKKLLDIDPTNVDALARLARAYAETDDLKKAKDTFAEVLKIDPYNTIAAKSLAKWKDIKKSDGIHSTGANPHLFLEEPGKTKIIPLMHLCSADVVAELDAGDQIKLTVNAHRVSILSQSGKYIGRLPDDISARIKKFTTMGYEYAGIIRSSDKSGIKVLIRETVRPAKYSDIPSFPGEKINYVTFTPPELVHKDDEVIDETDEDSPAGDGNESEV